MLDTISQEYDTGTSSPPPSLFHTHLRATGIAAGYWYFLRRATGIAAAPLRE